MSEPAWELSALERVDFNDMHVPAGLWHPTPAPAADNSNAPDQGAAPPTFMDLERFPAGPEGKSPGERFSAVLSLIPIVGTVKDIVEGISGHDVITGEKLSIRKRIFNFGAAAADLIGFGIAGRLAKGAGIAARVVHSIHKVGDVMNKVNDAEDVYTVSNPDPIR
jgi:hypothetical protein